MQEHLDTRIQVLVATMHQQDYALLDRLRLQTDAVVVNQCDRESVEELDYKGNKILWINTCERGLSKSRNMALRAATAQICMICDDDMVYKDGYARKVLQAFRENPRATLLRLEVEGIERVFRNYDHRPKKVGLLGSMKVSSVEIAFRREAVVEKGIWFDEQIGAGTQFLMGEENAFMFACLRNKLSLYYAPYAVADLHMGDSTWFRGFDEKYFTGRGAAFAAMDLWLSNFLIWQFAIRKYPRYKNTVSLSKAVECMNKGKKLYLQKKV